MDCSDDGCRDTFFLGARARRSVTSDMWRLRKTFTYLLTNSGTVVAVALAEV